VSTSLLLGEYPTTVLLSTVNSAIAQSLLSLPCRARVNSTSLHFTSLHSTSLHFTSLHSAELDRQPGVLAIYSLGTDRKENTASNSSSVVIMGGRITITRISFPRERVYRPLPSNACFFSRSLLSNGTTCYNAFLLLMDFNGDMEEYQFNY
jgi:hypothetical protein